MLRKDVTVETSEESLGLLVSPFVRLGTSTPICIPWYDMETGEKVAFRRTVTEYHILELPGYTIYLPSDIAKEVEAERRRTIPTVGLSSPEGAQRRTP